jgi:hypothetical protein
MLERLDERLVVRLSLLVARDRERPLGLEAARAGRRDR